MKQMRATLELNLSDALSGEELRELTVVAQERKQSIEKLLFEAAKALIAKIHEERSSGKPVPHAA